MKRFFQIAAIIAVTVIAKSCSSEETPVDDKKVTAKEVIINYAKIVHQNYLDSYNSAVTMQNAITAFTTTPTQENLDKAKKAWLTAREFYGQTEAYRESDGPIDTSSNAWSINNEGQMNAWPLDEGYIDYVTASSDSYSGYTAYKGGIIAGTETINEALLVGKNEKENDESISTGWHAIEFLLWGQDETNPKEVKPGQRPLSDYTTDAKKERRKTYLNVVTSILVKDLKKLADTWAQGGQYYTVFMALPENEALKNIVKGPFFLANEELSEERMSKPADSDKGIDNCGQEDEHSCFSDNTHRDVVTNAQGIINVIFGKYGNISGPSFYDLVKQKDETSAATLKAKADEMMTAINKIDQSAKNNVPFDLLLLRESITSPGIVIQGAQSLKTLGNHISASATVINISVK
ncbi:conserved hypothetical protein [Tenacibaculum litopenaei]|uniref:imelysin family protein n=1 Tax=Tenacibaculum litopenaei TaxID=396016 RepID=UPI0038960777